MKSWFLHFTLINKRQIVILLINLIAKCNKNSIAQNPQRFNFLQFITLSICITKGKKSKKAVINKKKCIYKNI